MPPKNNISNLGSSVVMWPLGTEELIHFPVKEGTLSFDGEEANDVAMLKGLSFDCTLAPIDEYTEAMDKWFGKSVTAPGESCVIVSCDQKIRKPSNLKYPNKKRARRIWTKWRNRYGVEHGKSYVFPRAKLTFKPHSIIECSINVEVTNDNHS